ncbi:MnmC family methyltransferase [Aliiglaciecola sp. 3_MG-2023]|uniref:spermine/spermidine synthase domain-containing protein n=1 Tax=Aliiglaciecola sp. 3_MG-2023 TaxID=3062644 RepID=UPI0026E18022|nr:MnmC family methyltransferase [Aliiglaciecola sp. 3_MG-2023]MDO6694719.1 MnmC family methyltransferase [Aliiglaciecola sp. 3_MG-2023]
MLPWIQLDSAAIPGGGEMTLFQREKAFSIRLTGKRGELMNSRVFNSEKELAKLGCAYLKNTDKAHVLVGGLGMGYTLAEVLKVVNQSAQVSVAELIPEVVKWNQGALGECAKRPLNDPRAQVVIGDVKLLLETNKPTYDAILLDVDNGPEGLTQGNNNWLYSTQGIAAIYQVLHPKGMLAVWSAGPDYLFSVRLKDAGFEVDTRVVSSQKRSGTQHSIFLARKNTSSSS